MRQRRVLRNIYMERLPAPGVCAPMAEIRPYHAVGILVVEDEPLVRMDALDLIEQAGFTVFETRGAPRVECNRAQRPCQSGNGPAARNGRKFLARVRGRSREPSLT